MASKSGAGNVTDAQIAQQMTVLNKTFAGGESSAAANTGFSFTLAGTDRFFNDQWHKDKQSATYRKATRKGGANALNIWLVDFSYLGIATFPWDYARNPGVDGIRVHYGSLPGGNIANYNLGETATHEAGHWFGLYHTFQGGCTATNDSVADTPAQGSSTNGCPRAATPAHCRALTRFTTTWTTATTVATTSSPPARARGRRRVDGFTARRQQLNWVPAPLRADGGATGSQARSAVRQLTGSGEGLGTPPESELADRCVYQALIAQPRSASVVRATRSAYVAAQRCSVTRARGRDAGDVLASFGRS